MSKKKHKQQAQYECEPSPFHRQSRTTPLCSFLAAEYVARTVHDLNICFLLWWNLCGEGHSQRTNTLCDTLKTSHQQCFMTTSAISVRVGEPPAGCDPVFLLLRWGAMSFSFVLSSHMQPFCSACGVGGTTLFMCAFMQRELDFMPWRLRSTCSGGES